VVLLGEGEGLHVSWRDMIHACRGSSEKSGMLLTIPQKFHVITISSSIPESFVSWKEQTMEVKVGSLGRITPFSGTMYSHHPYILCGTVVVACRTIYLSWWLASAEEVIS